MTQPLRWGMTIPLAGMLHEQRDQIAELESLGYTDVWSAEANGHDAFTPLVLASVWAPSLRLGTAIVPVYTRGRACLAQSVGSVAQAAPGRFALGIGSSSNVIVERWNGIPFEEPYDKVRARGRRARRPCVHPDAWRRREPRGRAHRCRRRPHGDHG